MLWVRVLIIELTLVNLFIFDAYNFRLANWAYHQPINIVYMYMQHFCILFRPMYDRLQRQKWSFRGWDLILHHYMYLWDECCTYDTGTLHITEENVPATVSGADTPFSVFVLVLT